MVSHISNAMTALLKAAGTRGFAVPQCRACSHRFYPPQSFCPNCLAPDIDLIPDDGNAIVLSTTRLHRTLDPAWSAALPVHVASVKTPAQLALFVIVDKWLPAGTPVRIHVRAGLFHAAPIDPLSPNSAP